ncbi:MAG: D-alanyl-D-alanine carboxypeptidase [Clostridia bacterium]|nr:D-alanyl-D-alanine carboxypeptidase [Clostridia bacterium]
MRAASMIASILLLFSVGRLLQSEVAAVGSPPTPSLSAASSVLYEANSETFVFTKDADTPRPMASTTKIMTALVAARRCRSLDETVTVPKSAVGIEGSSLYLRQGEQISLRELLYALLLQSANDSAVAIAVHISGSEEAFVSEMNRTATELGLTNTHFTNPHGLHNELHYTSARDLALISDAALKCSAIREIASTIRHTIPETNLSPARTIVNHNKLLRIHDGAVGLKTGFTKASGRCLVGALEKEGLSLISVTLNAPNDWDDHSKLFDYGRASLVSRLVAPKGTLHYEIPIIGSSSDSVVCTNAEDVVLVLPRDASIPEPCIRLSHFAVAPVRSGAVLGSLSYELNQRVLFECSLIAENSVDAMAIG